MQLVNVRLFYHVQHLLEQDGKVNNKIKNPLNNNITCSIRYCQVQPHLHYYTPKIPSQEEILKLSLEINKAKMSKMHPKVLLDLVGKAQTLLIEQEEGQKSSKTMMIEYLDANALKS